MSWAIVTGGSRGIGAAIVEEMGKEGFDVAILYLEQHDSAEQVAAKVRDFGHECTTHAVDVADLAQVQAAIADSPPVDVLVNCAGITRDKTLHKLQPADWHATMDVNLTGAFNCTLAVLDGMRERRYGRIVNISSVIGQTGNIGQAAYSASKAGLLGFTRSLALETAKYDITVNAVCPGFIDTDMVRALPAEIRSCIEARIPKRRFGTAAEVARVVAFLASPQLGYVTGQAININGGLYM